MAVALESLRFVADLDSTPYVEAMNAKVAADKRGAESAADFARSMVSTDEAAIKASRSLNKQIEQYIAGAKGAVGFEKALVSMAKAIQYGNAPAELSVRLVDGLYKKFGMAADSAKLMTAGYVEMAKAAEAVNRHYAVQNELMSRNAQVLKNLTTAQNAQMFFNKQFGIGGFNADTSKPNWDTKSAADSGSVFAAHFDEQARREVEAFNLSLKNLRMEMADPAQKAADALAAKLDILRTAVATGQMPLEEYITGVKRLKAAMDATKPMAGPATAMFEAEGRRLSGVLNEAMQKYMPLEDAQERLNRKVADFKALLSSGKITPEIYTTFVQGAQQEFDVTADAVKRTGGAAKLTAYQLQNLSYQVNDVVTSFMSGIPPMQIFAQQGGQIAQIFGPGQGLGALFSALGEILKKIITPTIVLTSAIAALGVAGVMAFNSYRKSVKELEDSLKGIGAATGVTSAGLLEISRSAASAADITDKSARSIVAAFARTGKVAGEDLQAATVFTKALSRALAIDLPEAADMASKAFAEPAKGAQDLDAKLGGLTARALALIESLQRQGDVAGAQKVLMQSLIPPQGAEEKLTAFGRAWRAMSDAISTAWDKAGQAGSNLMFGQNDVDALAEIQARLKELGNMDSRIDIFGNLAREMNILLKQEEGLKKKIEEANKAAENDAQEMRLKRAGIAAKAYVEELVPFNSEANKMQTVIGLLTEALNRKEYLNPQQVRDYQAALDTLEDAYNRIGAASAKFATDEARQMEDLRIQRMEYSAETADERIKAMEERARFNAVGSNDSNALLDAKIAADRERILFEEAKKANEALKEQKDALNRAGMSEFAKGLDEINKKFEEQIRLVSESGGALGTWGRAWFNATQDFIKNFNGVGTKSISQAPEAMRQKILAAATQYGIDPSVLTSLGWQESRFNANAVGPNTKYGTAKGWGQFIDSTWAQYGNGKSQFDADASIDAAARYLSDLIKQFGNVVHAVMAYNWGPGNVKNWISKGSDPFSVPKETRNYLTSILGNGAFNTDALKSYERGAKAVQDLEEAQRKQLETQRLANSEYGKTAGEIAKANFIREQEAKILRETGTLTEEARQRIAAAAEEIGTDKNNKETAAFLRDMTAETQKYITKSESRINVEKRSAFEVDKARIAEELKNEAMRRGVPLTGELTAKINETAAARAAQIEADRNWVKDQQAVNDLMSEFGNMGIDLFKGLTDGSRSFSDSLKSVASNLQDMLLKAVLLGEGPLAQLLGFKSDTPGGIGGIFGAALGNDVKALRKATADGTKAGLQSFSADAAGQGENAGFTLFGMNTKSLIQGVVGIAGIASSYMMGQQAQSPMMGAVSGAVSGGLGGVSLATAALGPLALAGPAGWAIAGIGALVGGGLGFLGGSSARKKEKEELRKQAEENYKAVQPQIKQLTDLFNDIHVGNIQTEIQAGLDKLNEIGPAIANAGHYDELIKLQEDFNKYINRLMEDFRRDFEGNINDLFAGIGQSGPFKEASQAVKDFGTSAKSFIDDTAKAFGEGSWQIDRAREASIAYALTLLDQVDAMSEVQKTIQTINGTASGLQRVLEELGMSAEDAARAIDERVTSAMNRLRDSVVDQYSRGINDATGKGYYNEAADLITEFHAALEDFATLGLDPQLANDWFKARAQQIVDGEQLAGDAFREFAAKFPELAAVVHEYADQLAQTADELLAKIEAIAARRAGYMDRLFAASYDSTTLSGQLGNFDRNAERQIAQEMLAGGEAIKDLEMALAAERLNIIKNFNDQAVQQAKSAVDSAKSELRSAYEAEKSTIEQTINKHKQYAQALREFSKSLNLDSNLSPLSPLDRLMEAEQRFNEIAAKAMAGDQDAMDQLQGASRDYLTESRNYWASSEQYYANFTRVQGILDAVANSSESQASIAQQQLDALNQQVGGLIDINESVNSVESAIKKLHETMAALDLANGGTTTPPPGPSYSDSYEATVKSLYRDVLGREGDEAGIAYWADQMRTGKMTATQVKEALLKSNESGTGSDPYRNAVTGLYKEVFSREPDAAGLDFWAGVMRDQNLTVAQMRAIFQEHKAAGQMRMGGIVGMRNGGMVSNGIFDVDSVRASYAGGGSIALAGGEYVMPARRTAQYLPILEAMRSNNYGASTGSSVMGIFREMLREIQNNTAAVMAGNNSTENVMRENSSMLGKSIAVSEMLRANRSSGNQKRAAASRA